jgi:hypothetical protein
VVVWMLGANLLAEGGRSSVGGAVRGRPRVTAGTPVFDAIQLAGATHCFPPTNGFPQPLCVVYVWSLLCLLLSCVPTLTLRCSISRSCGVSIQASHKGWEGSSQYVTIPRITLGTPSTMKSHCLKGNEEYSDIQQKQIHETTSKRSWLFTT